VTDWIGVDVNEATCIVDGCDRVRRYVQGWCPMHYQRWTRHGSLDKPPAKVHALCLCGKPVHASGMCNSCYRADHYLRNKERENATAKRYYAERAPEMRARNRVYYYANPEYFAARYQANKEAISARRKVLDSEPSRIMRRREREREWRKDNPGWALRNRENQRRRQSNGESVSYSAIIAKWGMVCHICSGEIESVDDLHFDHVIPLAKEGPHSEDNIRPSHALCNLRKGAKIA
jgi:HNH endonuclease